jgi:hypothetical protein
MVIIVAVIDGAARVTCPLAERLALKMPQDSGICDPTFHAAPLMHAGSLCQDNLLPQLPNLIPMWQLVRTREKKWTLRDNLPLLPSFHSKSVLFWGARGPQSAG